MQNLNYAASMIGQFIQDWQSAPQFQSGMGPDIITMLVKIMFSPTLEA